MMSANGQFHSPGPNDWVESIRHAARHGHLPVDEAVLEAAYDASEIDTATMFAYFEGRLSEEERQEVEAEVAASPHAMNKLSRIGAIIAQSRAGALPLAKPAAPTSQFATADIEPCLKRSLSNSPRVVHRVELSQPRPSIGSTLPRSEDCLRNPPNSPCEFFRSLEKGRDQVRIFHSSARVGTLVGIRILKPGTDPSDTAPTLFAVLRRGTESTTTTTLTIPLSFKRAEVLLELIEVPPSELTAEDGSCLLNSYENAAEEDPIAVSPLHEPRSAWQVWADDVLKNPADEVDPIVREVAELIAAS